VKHAVGIALVTSRGPFRANVGNVTILLQAFFIHHSIVVSGIISADYALAERI